MELYLVRHAESHHHIERYMAGMKTCKGITQGGREQTAKLITRLLAEGYQPDRLLASPIKRGVETATLLGDGLEVPVEVDMALKELDPGDHDGIAWDDREEFDIIAEADRPLGPNGESWNAFTARVTHAMNDYAARYAGQQVMAVTHSGFVIASIMGLLAVRAVDPRYKIATTGVTVWQHRDDRWWLMRHNDHAHLI